MKKADGKADAYENGAAKERNVNIMIAIGLVLLLAVVVGFNLGTPSKQDREKAEALQVQYHALKSAVDRASDAPRENWDCTQGEVHVDVQVSQRVVMSPGWTYLPERGVATFSDHPLRQTIKTVKERTTMKCDRQVKEYVEKAE